MVTKPRGSMVFVGLNREMSNTVPPLLAPYSNSV